MVNTVNTKSHRFASNTIYCLKRPSFFPLLENHGYPHPILVDITVYNLEGSEIIPDLQANKLACPWHSWRHETPVSDTKVFIIHNNRNNQSVSIFLFQSPGDGARNRWYLLMQRFEVQNRNSELKLPVVVNLSVFCSSRGFSTYMHMYMCVYIYICIYVCTKLLTFSFFSPEGALSLSPKAVCYLWKIVQNKASQYLCSQDVQKWKRMMENCLPIGLRLDEEFSQVCGFLLFQFSIKTFLCWTPSLLRSTARTCLNCSFFCNNIQPSLPFLGMIISWMEFSNIKDWG